MLQEWLLPARLESVHPEPLRTRMEWLVRAAVIRARRGLDDSTRDAAVLGAGDLREALVLVARAARLGEVGTENADVPSYVQRLLETRGAPPGLDSAAVLAALRATAPEYFDGLSNEALCLVRDSLERTVRWLREGLDVRSTVYLRAARIGRIAALTLGAVLILGKLVTAKLAMPNVALYKAVSGSALIGPGSGQGLVDGIKDGTLGVQTAVSEHPWVEIDLGAVFTIRRIVVYNRGDHNLNDGLPYDLEASEDGHQFRPVSHRAEPFGDGSFGAPPWTAKTNLRARYVRLKAHSYVALSEVEVFGRP
jgi:hypothetical protein